MAASEVLTVKGCGVKPAPGSVLTWSSDHTIGGRFVATTSGQLTITVHADAAVSADGQIELDGNNSGKTGLRGGIPRANDFVWQEACAQLNVRGLDSTLVCSKIAAGCVHGPPAPSICGTPPSWSQFEVSGSGLVAEPDLRSDPRGDSPWRDGKQADRTASYRQDGQCGPARLHAAIHSGSRPVDAHRDPTRQRRRRHHHA